MIHLPLLITRKFFSFQAQEDSVIAAILTKSSGTKKILGLFKIPKNTGQKSKYTEATKLVGYNRHIGSQI
jgi:hypothetical protein